MPVSVTKTKLAALILLLCVAPLVCLAQDLGGRESITLCPRLAYRAHLHSLSIASGNQLILASDNTLRLWDLGAGRQLRTFYGHFGQINSVAFSPDARSAVSAGSDNVVKIWDVDTGRQLRSFVGHTGSVTAAAFSPNGQYIVSGSWDKTIKLWSVVTGQELQTFRGLLGPVTCLSVSSDGRRIVSASDDNTITIWDIDTAQELHSFSVKHNGTIKSVAYSADSRWLAVETDRNLSIWNPNTGLMQRSLAGHVLSPDEKWLVVILNQDIELWNTRTSKARTLSGHTGEIVAIAFSSDARKIVSSSQDGTVKVWDIASGALLGTAVSLVDGGWVFATPEGFFNASSTRAAQNLSVILGLDVSSIDQFYNALYRPDLVQEKLAGDPNGKVKAAASQLDLEKVLASGPSPKVAIISPVSGSASAMDEVTVDASLSDQGGGIGTVEWRVNGVTQGVERIEVGADGDSATSGTVRMVRQKLALEQGDNHVEVLAYNAKNLIASEASQITIQWEAKIAMRPKLYVLAVGVNDYYDSGLRLTYAMPDAAALADGFRKAGAGLYAGVEVTKVLDADVTFTNLDKVFSDLGGKVQPRDTFVFFVAGRGKTKNGRYYFLPRDFHYEDESSIEKEGMDQDKFQVWLAKIRARKSIVLYDTCERGSLTSNSTRGSGIDERFGALNRMAHATGRTSLSATTDDTPALQGYHGHGVFTYALLDALDHADSNRNGLIEVSELAYYVEQKVPDFSFEASNLRQVSERSIVGDDFALAKKTEVLSAPLFH
jgi:WD40 repeat protein